MVGTVNFPAAPGSSRVKFSSLLYNSWARLWASNARRIAGSPLEYPSSCGAQTIPSLLPLDETDNRAVGKSKKVIVCDTGAGEINPVLGSKWNAFNVSNTGTK